MAEALFDLSAEYAQMLQQGLKLSGESADFFAEGRIRSLGARILEAPRKILDFGCGTGGAIPFLKAQFGDAELLGVDTSDNALAYARDRHGSRKIRFEHLDTLNEESGFDLCYVNGVFHHIAPKERGAAVESIFRALAPGGRLALFENNPWNPGTRMVMSRIPFDRDAITLPIPETEELLVSNGFQLESSWTLFYFPKALSILRFLEPALSGLPLGAQYCVLGTKPPGEPAGERA